MMRNINLASWVVAFVVLAAPVVGAQSWGDLTRRVSPGDTVFVTDPEGRVVSGVLREVTSDDIVLALLGDTYRIPADQVARVARDGDPVWNGAAIGAAAGLLLGAAACAEGPTPAPAACALQAGVVYGLLGAVIDYCHPGRSTVFRAPAARRVAVAPIVTRTRAGVAAAVRW